MSRPVSPARPAANASRALRREQYLQALGIDLWTRRRSDQAALSNDAGAPAAATTTSTSPTLAMPPTHATPSLSAAGAELPVAGAAATLWEELRAQVSDCRLCGLCTTRTQTVFGVGDRRAEVLVIGEAPGADEDRQGEPFVGRAGQLLNSMLRAFGRPRETVYIANVLKCRPPGNRDPQPAEVASCLPYLRRQIELLAPRLILVVGRIAAQTLLGTDTPIGRLRGRLHRFGAAGTPLVVTYHPAYLLRSPGEKRRAWADLKLARVELARLRAACAPDAALEDGAAA